MQSIPHRATLFRPQMREKCEYDVRLLAHSRPQTNIAQLKKSTTGPMRLQANNDNEQQQPRNLFTINLSVVQNKYLSSSKWKNCETKPCATADSKTKKKQSSVNITPPDSKFLYLV